MQSASKYYIVELHLVVNDQQNRFLNKAFDFGRMIYNATLGTALGQLQQMRESKEWAKITTCTDDEFTFQAVINKKSVFCQAIVDIA